MSKIYRVEIETYTFVAADSQDEAENWVRCNMRKLEDEIGDSYVQAREVDTLAEVESEARDLLPWNSDDDREIKDYFPSEEAPP